jgi:hypothetical protein
VLDANGEFIVEVQNEHGSVGDIDFGAEIDEVLFYKVCRLSGASLRASIHRVQAHPEVERKQTFLWLMSQMEFDEAELFLKGEDPGANGKLDPNVCYSAGRMTSMHMAALNDDVEGVQLLLKYGADKEFKSEDGETALDMAKADDSKRVIALLMAEAGGDEV